MSTTAFNSQGSQLQVSISSVFTLIPGVKGFNIPSPKQAFDDITNLDSSGGFPERLSIGKDFASTSFDIVWDPANAVHLYLEAAANASSIEAFKAIASDLGAHTNTFSAYVDFDRKLGVRKAGLVTVTLSVTGAIA